MNDELASRTITCPHCWEPHEVWLDLSGGDQTYIEDCSVCCHPIEITVRVTPDGHGDLDVTATQ